mgnify:CR=1 FL=1
MNSNEINEHINISKEVLEEKNIVVKNFEEIQSLADLKNKLDDKTLTIEGIKIDLKTRDAIYKLTKNNDLDTIHFNNCEINDAFFTLIFWLNVEELSITNCNLTPYQGKLIIDGLNPYVSIDLDLSNNNLGENGTEFLEFLGKHVDENIASLNLKGNGFKSEDINKFLSTRISDYDIYFDDIQEIDK